MESRGSKRDGSRVESAASRNAGLTPRRWQQEAMARWTAKGGRGVASVVTGAGKTALALLLFTSLRQKDAATRLVVVVPTLALLDQWWVALQSECGLGADEIALYSGESRAK